MPLLFNCLASVVLSYQKKTTLVSCVFAARPRSYPITLDKLEEIPTTQTILEEILHLKELVQYLISVLAHSDESEYDDC